MKSVRPIVHIVAVIVGLSLCHTVVMASPQRFSVGKRVGIGIFSNVLNFGIGPSAELWVTENLGVMFSIGSMGDFLSLAGRGQFLSSGPIAAASLRPYLGVGYASVQGPEKHWGGIGVETKGQGFEIFAGCLHHAAWLHDHVFVRGEAGYSTVEVRAKADATIYGQTLGAEIGTDYRAFTINLGISYFF